MLVFGQTQRFILGIFILLLVDLIWVASSELSKYIFDEEGFKKPFFSCYLKTSLFSFYLLGFICYKPWHHQCLRREEELYHPVLTDTEDDIGRGQNSLGEPHFEPLNPADTEKSSDAESDDTSRRSVHFSQMAEVRQLNETEAVEAMLSRLSFSASMRAEEIVKNVTEKYPVSKVAKIALIFSILWFIGNYSYQVALLYTEAGIVNVISTVSGLFTLILASIFPSSVADRFTISRFLCVIVLIIGMVFICLEDIKLESSSLPLGILWSLSGAFVYACYIVFLRRKVPIEGKMDLAMFFGFVGIFNAVLLAPLFIIFNVTGWETFEWPTRTEMLFMLVNGLIGTVFSELLWLWGCFLTSSLMATLSLSLTIPLTMLFDILLKDVQYSARYYWGLLPVIVSYSSITLLTHYDTWDPVLYLLRQIVGKFGGSDSREYRAVSVDSNEEENLILRNNQVSEELLVEDDDEIDTTESSNETGHFIGR